MDVRLQWVGRCFPGSIKADFQVSELLFASQLLLSKALTLFRPSFLIYKVGRQCLPYRVLVKRSKKRSRGELPSTEHRVCTNRLTLMTSAFTMSWEPMFYETAFRVRGLKLREVKQFA